ncbi:uncharacterized protein MONOS_9087 [Monocercomonoides exilis]|uniref:uncharacterized protein n=1 Tax=Monocercomonoides exilis TaxID=2049356 RepID=UPI0035598F25|nr:hypothetical protein MONOS_9087 [Monocercomonoides exilis]|eukprot:MONOS_9087.1-p1 / transcript=MONOS_9087.1 / gene=MONOS_9087 / organism=Monocercomonoides_exilis_PA203 / gene_product=unspecified product / transcript_product=unspecified product / location=Mono_scaffold00363:55643-56071(-) / protein_length=143 / sequence_SO=supercontig / SO=protein_coding / is_pseudo=false
MLSLHSTAAAASSQCAHSHGGSAHLGYENTTSRLVLLCFVHETFDKRTKLVCQVFFNRVLHPCHPTVAYRTRISHSSRNDCFFGVVLLLCFRSLILDAARLLGCSIFSSSSIVTDCPSAMHRFIIHALPFRIGTQIISPPPD